jgi:hypothetical protein
VLAQFDYPNRRSTVKDIIEIPVRELQAGDQVLSHTGTLAYTVLSMADRAGDKQPAMEASVEWADGGRDWRVWDGDQLDQVISIAREGGGA